MNRFFFTEAAVLLLLICSTGYAQPSPIEETSDTVWTKFTYPAAINAVKFTPDGKYLVSGGSDSIPRLWDAEFPKQSLRDKIHINYQVSVG